MDGIENKTTPVSHANPEVQLPQDCVDFFGEKIEQKNQAKSAEIQNECRNARNDLSGEIINGLYEKISGENPNLTKFQFIQYMANPESRQELLSQNTKVEKMPQINGKEAYEKYLKGYAGEIEQSLGLNNSIITYLIEQESMYGAKTEGNRGSKGLMQLNSAPFKDMQKDPSKYAGYFSKIPENVLANITPTEAKGIITQIATESQSSNPDYKKLSPLFEQLNTLTRGQTKNNDLLNIVCGGVYLAFCNDKKAYKVSKGGETSLRSISESELDKLSVSGAMKSLKNHKGYEVSPEQETRVADILKDIKGQLLSTGENETKKEYLTLREYNGSKQKSKYALSIMLSSRLNA